MPKKIILALDAPPPIGPYSQGVSYKELLFVSGQLPIDSKTGQLIEGSITEITKLVIDNMEAILITGDSSLECVLRVDIFLVDIENDFNEMNQEYSRRFKSQPYPARQAVQVAALPKGARLEMSCIAYRNQNG